MANATADTSTEIKALTSQLTTYTYDTSGQLVQMRDPAANIWTYTYDWAGRQVRASDPDAGTTTTTYDAAGRVASTTDGVGNAAGAAPEVKSAHTLAWTYDALDRPTALTDGAGATRATWAYDQTPDQAGKVLLGLPSTSTRIVDGASYTTRIDAYDEAGQALSTTVQLPTSGDLYGLSGTSYTTKYSYTADGQVASVSIPAAGGLGTEQVTTHYDTASMPSWLSGGFGWGTYVAESRFTFEGRPQALDLGNTYGANVSYQYETGTQRLTKVGLTREGMGGGTDVSVGYTYDPAGNVTSMKDAPTADAVALPASHDLQCFGYDGLRQLTQAWTALDIVGTPGTGVDECAPGPSTAVMGGAAPYWNTYTYDALGNRTAVTERQTVDGVLVSDKTTYAYARTGSAGPHALTATTTTTTGGDRDGQVSTTALTYDGAGNLLTSSASGQPVQALGWDAEGELAQIVLTGQGTEGENSLEEGEVANIYTAEGERLVRRDVDGVTVYLPGGQEVHSDPSAGVSATRYYAFAGLTVAVRNAAGLGGVESLVCDTHGTPLASVPNTTWTPTSVRRLYTDPFGGERGPGATAAQDEIPGDRQFLGKTRDGATGLTLLGARYYDETIGRFISTDPQLDPANVQQFNAYVYAGNNPVTFEDPSGLSWWSKIKGKAKSVWKKHGAAITGFVVGAAVGFALGSLIGAACGAIGVATAGIGGVACAAAGAALVGAISGAVTQAVTNLVQAGIQGKKPTWRSTFAGTGQAMLWGAVGGAASSVGGAVVSAAASRLAASTVGQGAAAAIRATAQKVQAAVSNLRKTPTTPTTSVAANTASSSVDDVVEAVGAACKRPNSFDAGTPVLMADGSHKRIEDVELGDEVIATDPETGEQGPRKVIDLIRHGGAHTMVDVQLSDGSQIDATDEHPFWVTSQGGWVNAIDLEAGDVLTTASGARLSVKSITVSQADLTAYNLTIADLHTYHVATAEVLVHNMDCAFDSVAGPGGEDLPLPRGAAGTPTANGKGMTYAIPEGTAGLDPRVTQVRIMQPVTTGKYQHPNGYVVYMNKAGQSVNPLTGQTLSKADPYNHLQLP